MIWTFWSDAPARLVSIRSKTTKGGTSKVIFAPEGVTPLLGALTLESLGLMVNPVTRELTPMRLMLAGGVPWAR